METLLDIAKMFNGYPSEDAAVFGLSAIVMFVFVALYSYKFFKISVPAYCALIIGAVGSLLGSLFTIDGVNSYALFSIGFAVVGVIFAFRFLNFGLGLFGAACGFLIGGLVIYPLLSFGTDVLELILSAVCAIIFAFLFVRYFKPLYIVFTSLVGMISAGAVAAGLIFTDCNDVTLLAFMAIGLVAGICAAVYQYRICDEYYDFL